MSTGRLAVYADAAKGVGTMIELKCESAPVAGSPDFKDLVNDIAKTLALGPGAKTPADLLAQKSLAHPDKTLGELKDDLFNRMREVFDLSRICRIDAPCGGYAHHDGSKAALVEIAGKTTAPEAATAAKEAARGEGKPENIIAKMIEGRLRNFFSQCVLIEQPFVKDDKQSVGQFAKAAGIEVKSMHNWKLGG
jgi:elongation factor Ts